MFFPSTFGRVIFARLLNDQYGMPNGEEILGHRDITQ